jgi:hypothetical protein
MSAPNLFGHSADDLPVLERVLSVTGEFTADHGESVPRTVEKIGFQPGKPPGYIFQIFPAKDRLVAQQWR